ncbi:MAG: GIY-YIG catalytic domain protein [Candidatus Azambacteria bacterium GW2011_GWA2_42_9]|nr:MAG: GIY-YIG catalytic domain protein [Candidatus Azambacteria bacterium GW2011_GWA1_42_19]KKS75813.1 MAG: GIY-YIG catalytic domain protein [Candidatus Azambacteria bacterium GW2011_GWA2_42_9]KKS88925.1 MAG: GIY-YIG catalytic domain protein [Parcubacteria group bacterium GW2011_GWC1_43_11]
MYVLLLDNDQLYIGFTNDLKKRIKLHKEGKVFTTKKFLPVKLVYYECYLDKEDAEQREFMIKRFGSTYSHLKKRITNSIKKSQGRG